MKRKRKVKAIALLSGGLDSRLAVKLLQEQGIDVRAVHFDLPFGGGCCKSTCSFNFTQLQGIPLKIIDCKKGALFKEFLNIVKKPEHGHGTAINPCIDCRILMLKHAKRLMKMFKVDFIATGEVLNERPMSQHFSAMQITESEAGLKGKIFRPLSAKLLPETDAEKKGLITRGMFLDIQGRSRKKQIELAKKFKISYPSPAGGCLLCEKEFAEKLRNLFKSQRKISLNDIELLKLGRHFRAGKAKIVVGRNEVENKALLKLAKAKATDLLLEVKDIPSPLTLIRGKAGKAALQKAAGLTVRYSDAKGKSKVAVKRGKKEKIIQATPFSAKQIAKLRLT